MTTQQKKNKFLEELLIERLIGDETVLYVQLDNKITTAYDFDTYCKAKVTVDLIPPYMSYYDVIDIVKDYLTEQYQHYLQKF